MEQFRIIVVHESPNDSEQIVNALRNGGYKVRATYVNSEEAFVGALDGQSSDIVISRPEVGNLQVKGVLTHVKETGMDIPVIVLADDGDMGSRLDSMRIGAVDVVPIDELNYLMLVLDRELNNLQERRFRRLLELEVEEMQNRCRLLLGSSLEPVAYVMDGMHIYANEAYVEKFGYPDAEEVECVPVMDVIFAEDQSAFKKFLKDYLSGGEKVATFSCRGMGNREEPFPMDLTLSSAEYEGEQCTQIMVGVEAVAPVPQPVPSSSPAVPQENLQEEVKEKLKAELEEEVKAEMQQQMKKVLDAKIAEMSSIDSLTGVYTKQYMLTSMNDEMNKADGEAEGLSSFFYLALDKASEFRDKYELEGVDELLKQIVDHLKKISGEEAKLAKISDVDFCLWKPCADEAEALEFAGTVREGLAGELFEIGKVTVKATVSIGITFVKPNVGTAYDIVSRAMKAAVSLQQEAEGNDVRIYRPPVVESQDGEQPKEATGDSLQKAIDNNLFKILFQPIISLRGEEFEFYEVLLRLIDDEGKEISPDQFLGGAQTSNLSEKIDRWVILQSIKTLAARRSKGRDTHVLINLTSSSVRDETLIPWLGVALKAAKLPKGVVTFQLNEQDAHDNLKPTKEFVEKLEGFGCKFSVSRFGMAEKPLDIFQHANVDFVKLDAPLIKGLSKGKNHDKLTELIENLTADNRQSIAPFVESAGVLSTLWQLGANFIQGYYLQPPMPDMSYDFSHGE